MCTIRLEFAPQAVPPTALKRRAITNTPIVRAVRNDEDAAAELAVPDAGHPCRGDLLTPTVRGTLACMSAAQRGGVPIALPFHSRTKRCLAARHVGHIRSEKLDFPESDETPPRTMHDAPAVRTSGLTPTRSTGAQIMITARCESDLVMQSVAHTIFATGLSGCRPAPRTTELAVRFERHRDHSRPVQILSIVTFTMRLPLDCWRQPDMTPDETGGRSSSSSDAATLACDWPFPVL
jgi:hypothetical protein